jgi:hypothetical protein
MPTISSGRILTALALLLLPGGAAEAAEQTPPGPSEAIFIARLVVLILIGRLLGEPLLRMKQPAVMGQLMAGLVPEPSPLGALFADLQTRPAHARRYLASPAPPLPLP